MCNDTSISFFIEQSQFYYDYSLRIPIMVEEQRRFIKKRFGNFFLLLSNEFRVKTTWDTLVVITLKTFCCFNFTTLMS